MRPTRCRWQSTTWLVVVVALAGCSSAAAGVSGERSTRTGSSPTATSVSDANGTTDTTGTGTTDTAIPETSTGGTDTPDTGTAGTTDGVSGVGDVLYPDLGNPGIDVDHYAVAVSFDRASGEIDGVVALTITAAEDLAAFTLDSVVSMCPRYR